MELTFQQTPIVFMKQVCQDVHRQEETGETIVPDSYPDIDTIIDAYAMPLLRGKDCRTGSVSISGGIKGGILYRTTDGQPCVLELYLPFTTKFENKSLTERSSVCCDLKIRAVDGKIINSRKAMLRVMVSCCIQAWEMTQEMICSLEERPEWLEIRERTYPVELPLEMKEKSFTVRETMELPSGSSPIKTVYKLVCKPEIAEKKVIANKAVFKGAVNCKLLYLTEGNQIKIHQFSIPFSQYSEMDEIYDEEQTVILPILTGCDLSLEGEGRGEVTLHMLGQCTIWGTKKLCVLEDAYSTQGILHTKWNPLNLSGCLDRQHVTVGYQLNIHGSLQDVLDTEIYADFPEMDRQQDRTVCSIPISAHIIGKESAESIFGISGIGNAKYENPVCCGADCSGIPAPIGGGYVTLQGDMAEIRGDLQLDLTSCGGEAVPMLVSCVHEPGNTRNPTVILKHVEKDSELWNIAKSCCAREKAIQEANQLDSDFVEADRLLLIPVG